MSRPASRTQTAAIAAMAATLLTTTLGATAPAEAFPRHGYYHRRGGIGVGGAIGLGIGAAALGAVAAGVASRNNYYNGYPAYTGGVHPGYGYDYYPEHGYYGPY